MIVDVGSARPGSFHASVSPWPHSIVNFRFSLFVLGASRSSYRPGNFSGFFVQIFSSTRGSPSLRATYSVRREDEPCDQMLIMLLDQHPISVRLPQLLIISKLSIFALSRFPNDRTHQQGYADRVRGSRDPSPFFLLSIALQKQPFIGSAGSFQENRVRR